MNRRAALATIAAVPLAGLGCGHIGPPGTINASWDFGQGENLREIYRWDEETETPVRVRMHQLRNGDCFALWDGEQWNWYDATGDPKPLKGPGVCEIMATLRGRDE